ncbi:MAG TPA: O-antigen ligase family protein [Anaerolineaceae bacterium]|jgi:hypothetical protein|nr:O-antigen ligase family protein [Anaerolineaceae bacterium]
MPEKLRRRLLDIGWASLALLLPVTSLPLAARLMGGTMVAPPATLVLAVLMLTWLLPRWIKGGTLPRQSLPLLWFALAALLSWAVSYFIYLPPFRNINRLTNEISAVLSLAIGLCFYLAAASLPVEDGRLQKLLRWINWGGLILILWSLAQAAAFFVDAEAYPGWMQQIQEWVSASGILYKKRVTGLAYEPSWLANQLNMLYLPLWLAASLRRTSAHSFRILRLSLETWLLAGGVLVLGLSFSRIGLASFLLVVAWLLLRANLWLVRQLQDRITRLWPQAAGRLAVRRTLQGALILSLLFLYLGLGGAAAFGMSRLDPRMADLFSLLAEKPNFNELAHGLIFGERAIFWQVGLDVFGSYPILGVGLDHAGYFIPERLPPFGWTMAEPHKLYYQTALPNLMSLWIRLLAETGIIGTGLFVSWLVMMGVSAVFLEHSPDRRLQMMGLAGQFALIALLGEGLSIDSFALPYLWLTFGLVTAASRQVPTG